MEAAADILSGSKSKAKSMPTEKLPGEVLDIGGPTPQDGKPTGDSEKLDTTKGAKSAEAPKTKSSDASSKMPSTSLKKEDVDQDIEAIFEDDTISEDFKVKAATIFEARVHDRITQITEEIETQYAGMLEEAVQKIQEDLSQKVDDYLSYVIEQWIEENQIAIETGLRSELAEEFISGLKNLFTEHYIDIPEEKVDLVDELSGKVVDLEAKLDEEISRGIEYKKQLVESRKQEVVHTVCEGLADTQVEKIKTLAESVDFSTEEEYQEKLAIIRENYFPTGVKKADESQLHESVETEDDKKVIINDPFVAAVSQAISKSKK
jgi:hypothetical protein